MSELIEWWPALVLAAWMAIVFLIAGPIAMILAGMTGLIVAALALWVAGGKAPCDPTADDRG